MNVAAQGGEVYVLTTTGSKLERHVFDQPVSQLALQAGHLQAAMGEIHFGWQLRGLPASNAADLGAIRGEIGLNHTGILTVGGSQYTVLQTFSAGDQLLTRLLPESHSVEFLKNGAPLVTEKLAPDLDLAELRGVVCLRHAQATVQLTAATPYRPPTAPTPSATPSPAPTAADPTPSVRMLRFGDKETLHKLLRRLLSEAIHTQGGKVPIGQLVQAFNDHVARKGVRFEEVNGDVVVPHPTVHEKPNLAFGLYTAHKPLAALQEFLTANGALFVTVDGVVHLTARGQQQATRPRFERRVDVATGKEYWVDHESRTTSWKPPSAEAQEAVPPATKPPPVVSEAAAPMPGPVTKLPTGNATTAPGTTTATATATTPMKCSSCGHTQPSARFCLRCGTPAATAPNTAVPTPTSALSTAATPPAPPTTTTTVPSTTGATRPLPSGMQDSGPGVVGGAPHPTSTIGAAANEAAVNGGASPPSVQCPTCQLWQPVAKFCAACLAPLGAESPPTPTPTVQHFTSSPTPIPAPALAPIATP
eukprot:EG_transcript_9195